MGYREPKRLTPPAAAGVKGIVAARARTRRETQRSLSEISSHAPPARRNDLAPAPVWRTALPTACAQPPGR